MSEEDLAARLDFRRPLHPAPEAPTTPWCIPFEYGSNVKGTRISVAMARQIAAELRAAVAEEELRQMRVHFGREVERAKEIGAQYTKATDEKFALMGEVNELKKRLRKR